MRHVGARCQLWAKRKRTRLIRGDRAKRVGENSTGRRRGEVASECAEVEEEDVPSRPDEQEAWRPGGRSYIFPQGLCASVARMQSDKLTIYHGDIAEGERRAAAKEIARHTGIPSETSGCSEPDILLLLECFVSRSWRRHGFAIYRPWYGRCGEMAHVTGLAVPVSCRNELYVM